MSIPHTKNGELQTEIPSSEVLHFFALGDTGSGDVNQYAVAHAMEKRCLQLPKLDGLLLLGDLFYMKGVENAIESQWDEKIVKPYSSPCLAKANMYPIFGNHDYRGNKDAFMEYSSINPRWKMPNRFYSVSYTIPKNDDLLRLVAIDSNFGDFCFNPERCVADFLIQELKKKAQWKIVLAHHPLSSASPKKYSHSGDTTFSYLFSKLSCGKADVWLSGHAHHLEHRKVKKCNTELFISGGGGGELEELEKGDKDMKFGSSEFGFLELEVSQHALITRFYNINAQMIYEKEIYK